MDVAGVAAAVRLCLLRVVATDVGDAVEALGAVELAAVAISDVGVSTLDTVTAVPNEL